MKKIIKYLLIGLLILPAKQHANQAPCRDQSNKSQKHQPKLSAIGLEVQDNNTSLVWFQMNEHADFDQQKKGDYCTNHQSR